MTYAAFANALWIALQNYGFAPGYGNYVSGAEPDKSPRAFWKQEGSVIYGINLFPWELGERAVTAMRGFCDKAATEHNLQRIVVFNIAVTGISDEGIETFVDSGKAFMLQEYFEINIAAILHERRIGFSKSQPDDPLGIRAVVLWAVDAVSAQRTAAPPIPAGWATAAHRSVVRPRPLPPIGKNIFTVYATMLVCATIYLLMVISGGFDPSDQETYLNTLMRFGGMNIHAFLGGDFWRVFSATFVHANISHLGFNCFALYIYGLRYERQLGTVRFLWIFIASALVANLSNAITSPNSVLVGASGGIYGLIGGCLAFTQKTRRPLDGLDFRVLLILASVGLVMGLADPSIGNVAHFVGLVSGYLLGLAIAPGKNRIKELEEGAKEERTEAHKEITEKEGTEKDIEKRTENPGEI